VSPLFGLWLFIVAIVVAVLYVRRRREIGDVQSGFALVGASDTRVHGLASVAGTARGQTLTYTPGAQRRGAGGRRCEAAMALPAGIADVEIHLTPKTKTSETLVRGGLGVDVALGDVQFDPQVTVEAAPAELVRAVLDAPTREHVLALMPCAVHVASGRARIERTAANLTPERVRRELALLLRLGERLSAVGVALGEMRVHALAEASDGYRGVSADGARAALGVRNAGAELGALRGVRRNRESAGVGIVVLLVAIATALWVGYLLASES
jgi:hypothetical protein